jgi:hypothetical protein
MDSSSFRFAILLSLGRRINMFRVSGLLASIRIVIFPPYAVGKPREVVDEDRRQWHQKA